MGSFKEKAKALVSQMTLDEKVSLLSGKDFWTTVPIDRLEIPSIWLADGPHGLRKTALAGIGESIPATCFPTASALASSWDRALLFKVGEALGKEAQAQDVQVLLGPGVNMKRSPLGGRNFEYFAEDPFHTGELAASFINGVQSQGVGTSLKHYTTNNQEFERMMGSSNLDERTLREIYLPAFEIAVKKAQPWTIMAAYNKVNGTFATENRKLLHDILVEEFGFEGIVVSDWGAVYDRPTAVKAGLHLEMPANGFHNKLVKKEIEAGNISSAQLDELLAGLVALALKGAEHKISNASYSKEAHHKLAIEAAVASTVLLKNEGKVLPLPSRKGLKIAVIGLNAKSPRYQGAGSSQVIPTQLDNAWDSLQKEIPDATFSYNKGYQLEDELNPDLVEQSRQQASKADYALLFVGLPPDYESEGWDRTHLKLPDQQLTLIEEVSKVQPNTVVILSNGSAVEMPFADLVPAIIEGWLAGQGGGTAVARVLAGKANPCGKLSETFPLQLEDTPAYLSFPGADRETDYHESIFIGYRHYDTRKMNVLFPYGHGLSYTSFEYLELESEQSEISEQDSLKLRVKIRNSGDRLGSEIVQVYVRDPESRLVRPDKELKQFSKILLQPGESSWLEMTLDPRAFQYFDPSINKWVAESGEFEILVGASSRDIRLNTSVTMDSAHRTIKPIDRFTPVGELRKRPEAKELSDQFLRLLNVDPDNPENSDHGMVAIAMSIPISKFVNFTQGMISEEMLQEMIDEVNLKIEKAD